MNARVVHPEDSGFTPGTEIIPDGKSWKARSPIDGHFYAFRGRVRPVKNLGWLRAHWKEVTHFHIHESADGGGHMIACLRDGGYYETEWADLMVCREWIHRPVFRGIRTIWLGEETKA